MKLEEISVGGRITGVTSGAEAVTVESLRWYGADSLRLVYKGEGGLAEVVLHRSDEDGLAPAELGSRAFDADGGDFRLAAEAQRIRSVGAADSMVAVATSAIQPLPHQLRAVYGELLPRTPLRFLLADDPGAGKTIMAGLYAKELLLREDVRRCLIVAPGGLVEQWQDELLFKFGLRFELLTRELMDAPAADSVAERYPLLIARMDQLARNEEWQERLGSVEWDLVVIDEAHRMGAHWYGKELERTRRYQLGEFLRDRTRHLLLMTATPHSGKPEDFQAFLQLLDVDRFAGRYRSGLHSMDTKGIMRRLVKEDLLTFAGTPLFPQRVAETVPYELSAAEQELYEAVSDYVRNEMNRADRLDPSRRVTVGFALTVLQRRLASSPEAIHQSLVCRSERLRKRRQDLLDGRTPEEPVIPGGVDLVDDPDEYSAAEVEDWEARVVDGATSAQTAVELAAELVVLDGLVAQSRTVRDAGEDRKWVELRGLLQQHAKDPAGKLIVFTEHRDTLDYLARRIRSLLGRPEAVEAIHGGVSRPERRRVTEEFTNNPECRVLLATDAAGEGLNLQAAHLVVNYDLPWNPNRIEQRFGRVHRIGQREVCRLWNLVAEGTREGEVFKALLAKVEEQRKAFGGMVFDVLGQAFEGAPLRELLLEAIRFGERPEVREHMRRVIDDRAGTGIAELVEERALAAETMPRRDVAALRREMDEARAQRLQPYFIERAFVEAFKRLGGRIVRREAMRWEITQVPAELRQGAPIARRYQRVTFDLDGIDHAGERAELLAPGHPLHDAVLAAVIRRWGGALQQGTVLFSDKVESPQLLVGSLQRVLDGTGELVASRFHYALIDEAGSVTPAGPAPHLDAGPREDVDTAGLVSGLPWLVEAEESALGWLAATDGAEFLTTVRRRRAAELGRARAQVTNRLQHEVNRLATDGLVATGKGDLTGGRRLQDQSDEMQARLDRRLALLAKQEQMRAAPPELAMTAVVLPLELASPEAAARARETKRVERRAVEAVLAAERALGRTPIEQAFNNKGFDILSEVPGDDPIRIEVKGRIAGADTFDITISEILHGQTQAPRYRLALVIVDPDDSAKDRLRYLADPFRGMQVGDFSVDRVTADLRKEWAKGQDPF
ncbi:DUF3883 domain-containing protein [Naumannella sp. ID2617S]|nr:DUF3883 domain-containing protein [Naumannella sp. ID2617S]